MTKQSSCQGVTDIEEKKRAAFEWVESLGVKIPYDVGLTLLNLLQPSPVDAWLDISTAPRDGTQVLGWSQYNGKIYIISFSYGCWDIVGQEDIEYRPTHWLPLPPPPNTADQGVG